MNTLPNGSASGAARFIECAPSVVLPQAHRASTDEAERGTQIHTFARSVLVGTPANLAITKVSKEWRGTCEHLDFTRLGGDLSEVRCEVAYALDVKSGDVRELGMNIGRDYARFGITSTELPGSDDIEGMRIDGVPVVLDIKTGWERVTICAENAQIMFFALVRMIATGAHEVEGRIAYVREDGAVDIDSHTFTRLELESFADTIEEAHARAVAARRVFLAGGPVTVTQGSHCRYCGAMPYCPAYTSLARSMVTDVTDIAGAVALFTDEQAGEAWIKAKSIEGALETILDALKERARLSPFPTPTGKIVKATPVKGRSSLSQTAALDLLRAKGATDAEIAGLYRQGDGYDAVKAVNPPKQLGAKRGKAA